MSVGGVGKVEPVIVLEPRSELGPEEASLRGEMAGALHAIVEVGSEISVEEHDRLGQQAPVLRCAQTQHVDTGPPGEVCGCGPGRGDSVGESGTIHVHSESRCSGHLGELFNLGDRVDRPHSLAWVMDNTPECCVGDRPGVGRASS